MNIIETKSLTFSYGKNRGVKDVDLVVKKGEVFGFLGPNGAGKSTTIKLILDIIRPDSGNITVFGMDSSKDMVEVHKRIGYLGGELGLYEDMKVGKYLNHMAYLRGVKLDKQYVDSLCERLSLDVTKKIKKLSRGNKQKVGLVAALMHKPELVILDEPTGGLDPVAQRVVLDIVEEIKAEGRTVFFSSHILSEVSDICDRVGIIREGELVRVESVERLMKTNLRVMDITFDTLPPEGAFDLDGVRETGREGNVVSLEIKGDISDVMSVATEYGVTDMNTPTVSLEDVFYAYYSISGGDSDGK